MTRVSSFTNIRALDADRMQESRQSFVQDVAAKCQKLIEDSSYMLFPASLCSQLVQRTNPNKDRETSEFFIMSSGPATEFNLYQRSRVVLAIVRSCVGLLTQGMLSGGRGPGAMVSVRRKFLAGN